MERTVILRNNATGKDSEVSAEIWKKNKNASQWRGVFTLVRGVLKDPPEVVALKARLAAQQTAIKKND